MRWVDYESDIKSSRVDLSALKAQREALEDRADNLRANPLVLDSLDIKARETLFNSHPNELTIWLDQSP